MKLLSKKKNPLIFIVDDDPMYTDLIRQKLLINNYKRVEVFSTGISCLNNLDKNPDIIILDYKLGDMVGMEVLKTIKEQHPNIQVIMLSGQQSINISVRTIKHGAYDYVVKDHLALSNLIFIISDIVRKLSERRSRIQFKLARALFFSIVVAVGIIVLFV